MRSHPDRKTRSFRCWRALVSTNRFGFLQACFGEHGWPDTWGTLSQRHNLLHLQTVWIKETSLL
ncbi:hypothetical protein AGR4B_pAt20201 [Agrobacterium tumefaciens str. CFBP 5621]|nr:hypothetical protein AGR4B_pAt20201 [Agrobacterium tumefaciens str. CFBP 5621]